MRYIARIERLSRYNALVTVEADTPEQAYDEAYRIVNDNKVDWEFVGHSEPKAIELSGGQYTLEDPHPDYPVADWQYEVANADTCLGYHDWVVHRLEG